MWSSTTEAAGWGVLPGNTLGGPPGGNTMSVLDLVRRQLLVFGGPTSATQHLWRWPLDGPGAWTVEPISGPPQFLGGSVGIAPVHDSVRDRAIIVPSALAPGRQIGNTDTVLTLVVTPGSAAWLPVTPAGTAPFLHLQSRLVFDAVRDRVLMLGGYTPNLGGGGSATNDLWALDLSGGMAWSNLIAFDAQFLLGAQPGACIDPTLDRVLIFGGTTASSAAFGTYNTVAGISLNGLPTLVDLDPASTSPMDGPGSAFFDAAQDRALFWNNTLWELRWDFGSVIVYCLLLIALCLLFVAYCLLFIAYCLLVVAYWLLVIADCLLLCVYCLLFVAYCFVFIVCCLLLIAY